MEPRSNSGSDVHCSLFVDWIYICPSLFSGDVDPVNVESRQQMDASVSETLRYHSIKEDSDVHLTNGGTVCSATGKQKPSKLTFNLLN